MVFGVVGLVGTCFKDSSSLSLLLCGGSLVDLVLLAGVDAESERRWLVRAVLQELHGDLVGEPLAALRDACLGLMMLTRVVLEGLVWFVGW